MEVDIHRGTDGDPDPKPSHVLFEPFSWDEIPFAVQKVRLNDVESLFEWDTGHLLAGKRAEFGPKTDVERSSGDTADCTFEGDRIEARNVGPC